MEVSRTMTSPGDHFVAVIGGAISGSVAAEILADHGIRVAVFDQNTRPYGKIEDGLPRWHVEQRKQEYERINERMKNTNVQFVPRTVIGRDVAIDEITPEAGLAAWLLAHGAWRDRPLPAAGRTPTLAEVSPIKTRSCMRSIRVKRSTLPMARSSLVAGWRPST